MDTSKAEIAAVSAAAKLGAKSRLIQFNHVATYPRKLSAMHGKPKKDKAGNLVTQEKQQRKWTVSDIAGEVDRDELHIPHVINPCKPILVKGLPPSELERLCEDVMLDAKQANGKKARSDTHCLLGAVYSLPFPTDSYIENKDKCDQFIFDAMNWHEKTYGTVVSAVMHLDETMIHWHVYSVDADARSLVPGWRAKRDETQNQLNAGVSKADAMRHGNIAYKQEMKLLQDSFYEEVGIINGLARYGDRRMRYQPGEARAKRLERERDAELEREARIQEAANRKKLEEDRAAQEESNRAAAEAVFEANEERKRAEHIAEYVEREKIRIASTVDNLTHTPQFLLAQEIREHKDEILELKQKVVDLKDVIEEKERYIDKLLSIICDLKSQLKVAAQKLLNKFR